MSVKSSMMVTPVSPVYRNVFSEANWASTSGSLTASLVRVSRLAKVIPLQRHGPRGVFRHRVHPLGQVWLGCATWGHSHQRVEDRAHHRRPRFAVQGAHRIESVGLPGERDVTSTSMLRALLAVASVARPSSPRRLCWLSPWRSRSAVASVATCRLQSTRVEQPA